MRNLCLVFLFSCFCLKPVFANDDGCPDPHVSYSAGTGPYGGNLERACEATQFALNKLEIPKCGSSCSDTGIIYQIDRHFNFCMIRAVRGCKQN